MFNLLEDRRQLFLCVSCAPVESSRQIVSGSEGQHTNRRLPVVVLIEDRENPADSTIATTDENAAVSDTAKGGKSGTRTLKVDINHLRRIEKRTKFAKEKVALLSSTLCVDKDEKWSRFWLQEKTFCDVLNRLILFFDLVFINVCLVFCSPTSFAHEKSLMFRDTHRDRGGQQTRCMGDGMTSRTSMRMTSKRSDGITTNKTTQTKESVSFNPMMKVIDVLRFIDLNLDRVLQEGAAECSRVAASLVDKGRTRRSASMTSQRIQVDDVKGRKTV